MGYRNFFSGCPNLNREQLYFALRTLAGIPAEPNGEIVADPSNAFPHSYMRVTPGFSKGLDPYSYERKLQETRIAGSPFVPLNGNAMRLFFTTKH